MRTYARDILSGLKDIVQGLKDTPHQQSESREELLAELKEHYERQLEVKNTQDNKIEKMRMGVVSLLCDSFE
jgi:hypothetical protein